MVHKYDAVFFSSLLFSLIDTTPAKPKRLSFVSRLCALCVAGSLLYQDTWLFVVFFCVCKFSPPLLLRHFNRSFSCETKYETPSLTKHRKTLLMIYFFNGSMQIVSCNCTNLSFSRFNPCPNEQMHVSFPNIANNL